MNAYKEGQMLTEIAQPQPTDDSRSETDLGVLAEHLSVIADALRKSTVTQAETVAGRVPGRTDALLEVSSDIARAATAYSNLPEQAELRNSCADIKMRRRRYSAIAREAYNTRRRRTAIFKSDELFGEPAWDILLDLYIAHSENKPVSVSSACIGSAAPPTTGLRWLGVLAEHELVLREHDPEDQRRVLVRLTEKGLAAMDEYFADLA